MVLNFISRTAVLKIIPSDEISIYTAENIYCGMNTISENETTLCALEKRVNGESSPRKRILKLLESNKNFGDLFNRVLKTR